jgi:Domain of unknown function DUF1828
MLIPCEQITEKIGELFICSTLNEYVRIRTPFLYPDGDIIDLFFKEEGEFVTLTDLGETLRWLRMQAVTQRKSTKQRQLINDICLNHGIEFYRGMLMVRFKQSEDFAQAVTRLSQAALRVSDLWFTFRSQASESITDEVEDLFRDRQISYQRSPRVTGRSGRVWRPDFHTRLPERSTLVTVLSTGSRSAAREQAALASATWHDLSYLTLGPEALKFISLFDDTLDVWTEEDFRLVEDISEVSYWSHPDEFLEKLAS